MTSKNPLGIFDALLERFRLGQYHVEDMKKRGKKSFRQRVMEDPANWPMSKNVQTPEPPGPYHYLRNDYDFRNTPDAEEQTVARSGKSSSLYGMSPGVFHGTEGKWAHPVKRKKK